MGKGEGGFEIRRYDTARRPQSCRTPKMSFRTVFAWPRAPGFRPAPERRGETAAYQVEHPRCHCGRYSRGPAPLDSGLRRKDEGRRPHIMSNTQDVIADGIRVAPRPWIPD